MKSAVKSCENSQNQEILFFLTSVIPFVTEQLAVFVLLENEILGAFTWKITRNSVKITQLSY